MATALADTFSTRPDHSKRLWQVPLFLVGVAAFVGTYQGWLPLASRDPSSRVPPRPGRSPSRPRQAKPRPQFHQGPSGASGRRGEGIPGSSAPAHFALGTGYMRLAELSADPAESLNYWMLSKQHFDEVRPDQLADPADGARLTFRAAKARAATPWPKASPAELDATRRMLLTPPYGEESGEGHRLAAELGLRLVPPDLTQAKSSFTAYIADSGIATPPASIARAKLRLSEVYRQLGDIDGAKKWLAQIGTDAPTDVLRITKAQLAHPHGRRRFPRRPPRMGSAARPARIAERTETLGHLSRRGLPLVEQAPRPGRSHAPLRRSRANGGRGASRRGGAIGRSPPSRGFRGAAQGRRGLARPGHQGRRRAGRVSEDAP